MTTSLFSAVKLVAGREIMTRLRSKAYVVLTLVMVGLLGIGIAAIKLFSEYGGSAVTVAVPQADMPQLGNADQVGVTIGAEIAIMTVPDVDAGAEMVTDGEASALFALDADGALTVTVDETLAPMLDAVATLLAQNLLLEDQIRDLGGRPAQIAATVAGADFTVDTLSPPKPIDLGQLLLGSAAGILIFITLQIGGQYVAQGVVEEKSSRVVELLLSTIRPVELMIGKVLGIGLLGLVQMLLYTGVGVGLSVGLGLLSLSLGAAFSTIIWLIVWYLVGFVIYAFAFAGAAALVSRQEDVAGVIMPILMLVIVPYVAGISVLPSDPTNSTVGVLSLLPPFAPILMPMRIAMGTVPAWEVAVALVAALALIPLLAALAGRMYRNAVIHIGARVSLRKALARVG